MCHVTSNIYFDLRMFCIWNKTCQHELIKHRELPSLQLWSFKIRDGIRCALVNSTAQSEITVDSSCFSRCYHKLVSLHGKNWQVCLWRSSSSKTVHLAQNELCCSLSAVTGSRSMGISTRYHLSAVVKERDTEHDIQLRHWARQNFSCIFSAQGESEPSRPTD